MHEAQSLIQNGEASGLVEQSSNQRYIKEEASLLQKRSDLEQLQHTTEM